MTAAGLAPHEFRESRESCENLHALSECSPAPATSRFQGLHPNLKSLLRIFSALILDSSVDGGMRSLAAAPDGPEIRPLLSASADSIISRSLRPAALKAGDDCARASAGDDRTRALAADVCLENQDSSTEKTSRVLRITDLSMTFCNSRMLPGQS